jgi:hypothetical protein
MDPIRETRLPLIGIWILVIGLLAAAAVYFTASPDDGSGAVGYEVVNGQTYPVRAGDTKSSDYQLERIGGKSAVWGVEFTQWLGSLWRGRRLAYTLFIVSSGGCLACFALDHFLTHPRAIRNQPGRQDP